MKNKGTIAPFLASPLVNFLKLDNKSQFRLKKDHNSIGINDFLINTTIPNTLYSNVFFFKDSNGSFKRDGDLLETIANYKFNVGHSSPQDQKLVYSLENK